MRKIFLVLLICTLCVAAFVAHILHKIYRAADNNISINVKETDDTYKFYASYNRYRTSRIQNYMDHELHSHVFKNGRIDADMVLDHDKVKIHVVSRPGLVEIKLDKSQNDSDTYYRVKEMGEGIKKRLSED